MKCCVSSESSESAEIDRAIDRELRRLKHESSREVKLLLLGSGESGKSTFIKQMRIIHGQGFSEADCRGMRTLMFKNVVEAIGNLHEGMRQLRIDYDTSDNRRAAELVSRADVSSTFSPELVNLVAQVWRDKGIGVCYSRRNEYYIGDSAAYFLDRASKMADVNFVPCREDVLRARAPTTGIQEFSFELAGGIRFRFMDVAGQRSERRKWIHVFECATSIIFLVALSEYDQRLMESQSVNRLEESRALFRTIIGYKWFERTSIILFLNKTDLLEEKILNSHLQDYFPDFKGPKRDAEAAKTFIASLFISLNFYSEETGELKNIYSFETCATDTENIRLVFAAVKDTIMQHNLLEYNLA